MKLFILIFIFSMHSVSALGPVHRDFEQLFKKIASENWVEARDAVKEVANKKIKAAENQLLLLLNEETNVTLLEEAIKALVSLQSKIAYKTYIDLFLKIHDQMRYKFVLISIINALGWCENEEAIHFLGSILNDHQYELYLREHAAKNLGYFNQPEAAKYLIKALQPEMSVLTKRILISLRYNARKQDIQVIKSIIDYINRPQDRDDYDKAVEWEVGDFSKSQNNFVLLEFLKTSLDVIVNKFFRKVFVLGDIQGVVNSDKFEETFQQYLADGKLKVVKDRKNRRPIYISDSDEIEDAFFKKTFIPYEFNKENPEVQVIIDTLKQYQISFKRSRDGLLMEQNDNRVGRWSKDGSVLIPSHNDYIPVSFNFGDFPVRGETAIISGREPLMVRSRESISSFAALKAFGEKFPDINIESIPHGYVTVKMASGEVIALGTSHIDCVFDIIPSKLTKDGFPLVLIDPYYYEELMSDKETSAFLFKLKSEYLAKLIIIPREETYLNPSNFILLPEDKIIMNKAPLTYQKLLDAGIKPDALIMTLKEIYGIAPLKGMIGCLGGIYTEDRVVSSLNDMYIDPEIHKYAA